jgi:TolB-like protein
MNWSTRCLTSGSLLCAACSAAPAARVTLASEPFADLRLVVLPPENVSNQRVPLGFVQEKLVTELSRQNLKLVPDTNVKAFLAHHRVRYVGGINARLAALVEAELEADAVLVSSVRRYTDDPPEIGLSMRLVSSGQRAEVLWTHSESLSGEDSAGLLGIGRIHDTGVLLGAVLEELGEHLGAFLRGAGPPASSCEASSRFAPQAHYVASGLTFSEPRSIAVLPFVNRSRTRAAGDALVLDLVRQLHAYPQLQVIEPGLVRQRLLDDRVMIGEGISVDGARLLLEALHADLILTGVVFQADEPDEGRGIPLLSFSLTMLDRKADEIVWKSSSIHEGDDGVILFDVGSVTTGPSLACRMAAAMVHPLLGAQKRS